MKEEKGSFIRLTEYRVYICEDVMPGEDDEFSIRYIDHPGVRDAARKLLSLIIDVYGGDLFSALCGRCGNCCKLRPIPVNAREIMDISLFLDIPSESAFRKRYIEPAFTWNSNDGMLKRVDGCCVFLKKTFTGKYLCAIHPVRPETCAIDLKPDTKVCNKSKGLLIHHVDTVLIAEDFIKIKTKKAISIETKVEHPEILKVAKALQDRTKSVLRTRSQQRIGERMGNIMPAVSTDLREDSGREEPIHEEETYARVDEEKSLPLDANRETKPCDESGMILTGHSPGRFTMKGMRLSRESVEILGSSSDRELRHTMIYRENPWLLPMVRELAAQLVQSKESSVQEALWHINPPCLRCGRCCGSYAVELSPIEIERIAEYLRISLKKMWKNYLRPGVYTWNSESGLLQKELARPLWEDGLDDDPLACVFLRKKSKEQYVCAVYDARPDVCREYIPHGEKCRKMTHIKRWDILVGNILKLDAIDDVIYLSTRHTEAYGLPALSIPVADEERIGKIYSSIKEEVARVLSP